MMTGRNKNGTFAKGNDLGKKFQAGEVNNPNGRNGSVSDMFKDLSESTVDEYGKTQKQKILEKILTMAENGSLRACELYINRTEGKPREFIEQRIVQDELVIE